MGTIPILFEIETDYSLLNDDVFINNFKLFFEEFNLLIYNEEEVFSNDSMMRYDSEVTNLITFFKPVD